jgi:hypothetical protein
MALRAMKQIKPESGDESLNAMVIQDPIRTWLERRRLAGYEIPVWAIIGHLHAVSQTEIGDRFDPAAVVQTASDYHIPEVAVLAAIAYYRKHRILIDGLLARHAAAVS